MMVFFRYQFIFYIIVYFLFILLYFDGELSSEWCLQFKISHLNIVQSEQTLTEIEVYYENGGQTLTNRRSAKCACILWKLKSVWLLKKIILFLSNENADANNLLLSK